MISPLTPQQLNAQPCLLLDWGLVSYSQAWEIQQKLVQERRDKPDLPDVLILLEHPPVYTLGMGAKLEFLKFDPSQTGPELHRVERGGEVTYHCPGPIGGLSDFKFAPSPARFALVSAAVGGSAAGGAGSLRVEGFAGSRYDWGLGRWVQGRCDRH